MNKDNFPCIISRDCCGGFIYKHFGQPYTSPTIGLYMDIEDFILFCCNLENFLCCELEQISTSMKYPVGMLRCNAGQIKIFFMHYSSFFEAKEKWDKRAQRINLDNILVVCDAKANVSDAILSEFSKIPYNKLLLSSGINTEIFDFGYNMPCYSELDSCPDSLLMHDRAGMTFLEQYNWDNIL